MNNGVNNSEISIEPVQEPKQPVTQPVIQQATQIQATQSLGSNVRIAPAQPMYNAQGQVIQQQRVANQTPSPQITTPPPVVTQPAPTPPGEPPQIQIKKEEKNTQPEEPNTIIKTKKRRSLSPLYIIIIIGLIGALIYINNDKTNIINEIKYQNIVINTNDKKIELDKDSTIVQELYSIVATNVKEDLANPNLDDEMKRYLAYRQITSYKFYESNCNLFDRNKIFNYTCDQKSFTPLAFKEEALQLEIKKIFGESSKIENGNIQLGRQCIGGYEYIAERGEYVQGQCIENNAITISDKKSITEAYRINDEIYIIEEVRYISGNKGDIPSILKDGIYTYRFKLDTNLNYAYISKEYRTKY